MSSRSRTERAGEREALLESLDATSAGIAAWNGERVLVYANQAFLNAFDLHRKQIGDLVFAELARQLAASNELVLAAPDQWIADQIALFGTERQFDQQMSDGRTLEVVYRPSPDGGMTVTLHDVSNLKRTEFALRRAKDAAESSGEAKSRFLRAANHDLRQPLATLRILIYNCLSETDEEHRKDLFHAMDISVSIMEDLLSSLLQIGQLDAGQIVARVTTFQLAQVFDRLNLQFSHQASEKVLGLRFVSTRAAVVTDKALLERVLSNFLANAIRYTDVGGVVIGCRRAGQRLRIEVWDTGRGIPPEHRDRIFEEFYQIPDGRRAKRPGLGLGLNIVHRLASLLGHRVALRSRPGKGSVFSIEVPLGDVWQSEPVEPEISEMVGGEFAGISVLLIEDDEVLQQATKQLLERWGIRVSSGSSAAEARLHLADASSIPDLIIADYSLRGHLGTNVVRDFRTLIGQNVPALIVTADAAPEVVAQIKAEGLHVLIKPVSPPRLRIMMHNLLFEPGALLASTPGAL